MKDYYRILQVDPEASFKDIKQAYRKLAKKYHPDRNANEDAELRIKEVNTAYGVLSCPVHRNEFDAIRLAGSLLQSQGSFISVVTSNCKECFKTGYIAIRCNECKGKGSWHEKRPYGKTEVNSKLICTICQGSGKITCICFGCAGTGKIRKFKKYEQN